MASGAAPADYVQETGEPTRAASVPTKEVAERLIDEDIWSQLTPTPLEPQLAARSAGDGFDLKPGELRQKARSGVLWVAGINVFRDIVQFGTMLVLVRLLEPKVYGEATLVNGVMLFFTIFSFRSFFEHILQVRPHEAVDYQSHFTAAGIMQAVMFTLVNITASVLRQFPEYAEIAPYLHVMSVFFIFDWAGEFRVKILQRELNWTRLRTLEAIGVLVGAASGLALALLGGGTYALILPGMFFTLPFIYDLFVVRGWRPDWTWRPRRLPRCMALWSCGVASGSLTASRPLIEAVVVVHVANFASPGNSWAGDRGLRQFAARKLQLPYSAHFSPC